MMNSVDQNVQELTRQKSLISLEQILTLKKRITFLIQRVDVASYCDQSRASSAITPLFRLAESLLLQTMTNNWPVNHTAIVQHAYQKAFSY
jgi:hypothetical protein